MKDSIIFDLDGTLWDARDVLVRSWNSSFERLGVNKKITVDELTPCLGLTLDKIAEKILPSEDMGRSEYITEECCKDHNIFLEKYGGRLYPHFWETIKELKRSYRLFIVSNCREGYIESFLNAHKAWDFFEDIENNGRTGLDKAGNIRLVAERNSLSAPVYVGDTISDMESAKKVGVPFIFASYGFGKCDGCENRIEGFEQLVDLMRGL